MDFFIIKDNWCFIFVKITRRALLTTAGLGSKNCPIFTKLHRLARDSALTAYICAYWHSAIAPPAGAWKRKFVSTPRIWSNSSYRCNATDSLLFSRGGLKVRRIFSKSLKGVAVADPQTLRTCYCSPLTTKSLVTFAHIHIHWMYIFNVKLFRTPCQCWNSPTGLLGTRAWHQSLRRTPWYPHGTDVPRVRGSSVGYSPGPNTLHCGQLIVWFSLFWLSHVFLYFVCLTFYLFWILCVDFKPVENKKMFMKQIQL